MLTYLFANSIQSYILLAAAVIPAVFLVSYIYKEDRLEKEPGYLIGKLLLFGVLSTVIAIIMETVGSRIVGAVLPEKTVIYNLVFFFAVVGFSEEFSKYVMLKIASWNDPNFNCKFDAIVYAVTVSMGFALLENIKYVKAYGLATALVRALTAIPGHACFGVCMGVWYGIAKRCELSGDDSSCRRARRTAVIMPALIHGAYDFIASMQSYFGSGSFFIFVGIMFLVSFKAVKRLAETDDYL